MPPSAWHAKLQCDMIWAAMGKRCTHRCGISMTRAERVMNLVMKSVLAQIGDRVDNLVTELRACAHDVIIYSGLMTDIRLSTRPDAYAYAWYGTVRGLPTDRTDSVSGSSLLYRTELCCVAIHGISRPGRIDGAEARHAHNHSDSHDT